MHTNNNPNRNVKAGGYSGLWKLVGKAIATKPGQVRILLNKHGIKVGQGQDHQVLMDGILLGLGSANQSFQTDISSLLSDISQEDHFIQAIAAAVGAVAGAIGSGQQKKAAKEQANAIKADAKAKTLSSILAYKAQQDQTRVQATIQQGQIKAQREQTESKRTQTIVIVAGIAVALIVIVLFISQKKGTQPVIRTAMPAMNK